jgi:mannose-6-phosphate isomerase-like protein (cupin superfamily)
MARPGGVIEAPSAGERVVFRRTAKDTNGELLQFDFFLKPHGPEWQRSRSNVMSRTAHLHPLQEERFEVMSGTMGARIGGREQQFRPGETAVVPPGTPHLVWNAGDEEAHIVISFRPALNSEEFFETLFGLYNDGNGGNRLRMAVLLRAHRGEGYLADIPIPVQKAMIAILAPIGRLLGYKPHYARYSAS